jgi:glycosyltransferase involved in cell wall biosynthesis
MRTLFISHTGMSEPLGQTQVLPYLRGLARAGADIEIVGFEPASASEEQIADTTASLSQAGIRYSWTRRSPSHALAVKAFEMGDAFMRLLLRAAARRPHIVHARSHLPTAVGRLLAATSPRTRLLFDCRGLMADEYADSGHWRRSSMIYRLVKSVERHLFSHAAGIVTLTEALRRMLLDQGLVDHQRPFEVIPCCVDVERFRLTDEDRAAGRQRLEVGSRFVLAYAGNLGSWYQENEMAELFAAVRRRAPALFLVLSHAPADRLQAALERHRISADDVRLVRAAPREVPSLLAAADAAVSFSARWFCKVASSPVKHAEYLAMGLPMVMSRGIGDSDELIDNVPAVIDAGNMTSAELERAAERLLALDPTQTRSIARKAALERFSLEEVGVARYRRLYERMVA